MTTEHDDRLLSDDELELVRQEWGDDNNNDPGIAETIHYLIDHIEQQRSDIARLRVATMRGEVMTQSNQLTLFQSGNFTLHSGEKSSFKIDCDALLDSDIETLAAMIADRCSPFGGTWGIPMGGLRMAKALDKYGDRVSDVLIVDDVLTTGGSMERARQQFPGAKGAVIFARGKCPDWIMPLFTLTDAPTGVRPPAGKEA